MPNKTHCYRLGNGMRGFIRGALGPHCEYCGTVSTILCDFPVGNRKTCDRHLCDDCAHEVGIGTHLCRAHFAEWEQINGQGQE